jgi:hypothetical protein
MDHLCESCHYRYESVWVIADPLDDHELQICEPCLLASPNLGEWRMVMALT